MTRNTLRSLAFSLATLALLLAFNFAALGCPPPLCQPFEIENARSLPWDGAEWRDVKTDYDISRLARDTLALLGPEAPVIARMETLRRATVYSAWAMVDAEVGIEVKDLKVARELLERLQTRAREAKGKAEALALFDLGYLVENYRRATRKADRNGLIGELDGYGLIVKAISLRGGDPEMEFAAALITADPRRDEHSQHVKKAYAGAIVNERLARNLAKYFKQ
ncbi:MAG: hypothetical protein ACREAM_06255 [Blastocatellia bacterium]